MVRPLLPFFEGKFSGKETMRVGVSGKPFQATLDQVRGEGRIRYAATLTTGTNGQLVIKDVPVEATVLIFSPRTDGAVQRGVTRSGTDVTINFRVLQTGVLPAVLSSLFGTATAVTFDFLALEPVKP